MSPKSSSTPLFVKAVVAAAVLSATEALATSDTQQRPNFIVIQPDDHRFLEEWNPPGRFQAEFSSGTMSPTLTSSSSSTSSTSSASIQSTLSTPLSYISPVPNINRIRDHGLEMTNAYAASTMCGTSRYSTITGRLPSRSAYGRNLDKDLLESSIRVGDETSSFFLRDVIIPRTKLEDARGVEDAKDCTSNNLVAVLQQNGYNTGAVGKWHLGAKESINGEGLYDHYPQVQEEVRKCGFDFAEAIYRENLGGEKNLNVDGEYVTHNMEHVTAEAIRFIQQSVNSNKSGNNAMGTLETRKTKSDAQGHTPFFLYFNPTVPHSSGDVTDALLTGNCRDTVQGRLSEAPFVPYGMTANVGVGGNAGCRMYRKTVLERAAAAAASMGERDDPVDDSLAGAVWVDDAIGSLFETLEALDILDNTVILFQLDHGMDAKGSLFEGGSRIVQFVHYPDRIKVGGSGKSGEPTEQQGWKFDGLVSTVDIAPTLMDLAGVPSISRTSDGAVSGKDSINEDNDNQDNPAQYRYDMDGKSWFSEVVAANTNLEKEKNSFEQLQQSEQQVHRRRGNINYFQERCLFVEQGLDRSVRCGCYKYIYVSDLMDGFTAWRAQQQGANLDTHNFYYLCDKNTGNYINSPESSPELWSLTSDSNVVAGNRISDKLKTKLKNRVACLLKQTNPANKFPDYETDCGLPLHDDKLGTSTGENVQKNSSSTATLESVIIGGETPIKSPEGERPTSLDVGAGDDDSELVPFLRSPSSSSIVGTMPRYALIIASLILILAPCVLYWMYREFCRRVIVGAKADRYRSKVWKKKSGSDSTTDSSTDSTSNDMNKIEKGLLNAAITTKNTRAAEVEVGSVFIRKSGFQIAKEFGADYLRSYHPSIWLKLADEAKRQAFLRAKWNIYTVSGVVIETSSNSVGTVQTSGTIETDPGLMLESGKQNSDDDMGINENEIWAENPNEDTEVPNLGESSEGDGTQVPNKNEDS